VLVVRAQQGDADAFGTLVERHAPMTRRLARAVLRHPEDADDAAQDAFVAAWTSLGRFDPAQGFAPWMARIALNTARDLARRRRVRQTEPIPLAMAGSGAGPEQDAERRMVRERLDAALADLPERQRLAVVLHDAEGYRHSEIAELLDIPEGTVRSDVFQGRRRLRATLAELRGAPE
jgi:RNA polymerase sigma-70 factor (ECF subfamily)